MTKAAEYLRTSYDTFRRQAMHYGLWQPNTAGKGIWKAKRFKVKEDVFTKNSVVHSHLLHKWLKRERTYSCEECGISEWKGKELSLEIDHINGNKLDNRLENLRYLCPNCHAQTHTWRGRNKKNLSASKETQRVEFRKFGETFKMAIPSEALKRERVETKHGTP